jgi:mannose-6-phosphate isomerase class I
VTYFGFDPSVTKEMVRQRLLDFENRDTRLTELSRAYRLTPGTGWYVPAGVVHAPGSLLTYEPQWNSDVASIFEKSTGRIFLTKDWESSRKIFEIFSQDLETSKVTVELARKDLEHAQQLAKEANVACPLFDRIVEVIHNLSYKEVNERWEIRKKESKEDK